MTHSSAELLADYQRGDDNAAERLFARYSERLLALARSRLSAKLARRIDADDVVQSTYRSFFARAREGQFVTDEPGDLWRLLATISLHKVRRQVRRHRADRRSVERETPLSSTAHCEPLATSAPLPEDVIAVGEEFDWLLSHLSPSQGEAIQLRLQGLTFDQVAHVLGRSERTVRRWLEAAQALLADRWMEIATHESRTQTPSASAIDSAGVDPIADAMPLRHADYHIERMIGAGGICKVYVAIEKPTGRRVAVKVLRRHLQRRADIVARFIREAEIVRLLAHPRIVAVHGLGRLPRGGCFMVMDHVDGTDLEHLARKGPLDPRRAVGLVATIADPIHHAHEHGVVHRDLKPGNVLLDRDGNVFVSDFGFAWLHAGPAEDTAIVGTAGFMAPEQIDPRLGPIGPWTDVYGLGALLFELLTGKDTGEELSDGDRRDVALIVNAFERDGARSTAEHSLAKIVSRCLATDWRQRFATALQLRQALQESLEDGGAHSGGFRQ